MTRLLNGLLAGALLLAAAACGSAPSEHTVSETPAAEEQKVHTRMGSHGMVVIGKKDLSFYHLALYRPPHDRQILTPADFASPDVRAQYDNWRSTYQGIVTIVPENFDLDRLAPDSSSPITQFKADIYEGHFERGGTLKFEAVVFNLSTPLLHKNVQAETTTPVKYTYIVRNEQAFLIKDIGPRPGADEIFAIAPVSNLAPNSRMTLLTISPRGTHQITSEDGSTFTTGASVTVYKDAADFQ